MARTPDFLLGDTVSITVQSIMKCIICKKDLNWLFEDTKQPEDGGEVQIRFSYGSKLDEIDGSYWSGVICDDCGSKLIEEKIVILEKNLGLIQ